MLKTILVRDYMVTDITTFSEDADMLRAVHTLAEGGLPGAPVVDDSGKLVGLLSEQDCLKVALSAGFHESWGGRVSEYMSRDIKTVDGATSIVDVAILFLNSSDQLYPVMDGERLVGQISRREVLRALEMLW